MPTDYRSQTIDAALLDDLSHLVRLAIREDLDRTADLTTLALVPQGIQGSAVILPRVAGVAAGVELIEAILQELDSQITWTQHLGDGERFEPKQPIATLTGETRDLLTCERFKLSRSALWHRNFDEPIRFQDRREQGSCLRYTQDDAGVAST